MHNQEQSQMSTGFAVSAAFRAVSVSAWPLRRRGGDFGLRVPRQQFAEPIDRVTAGHAIDHVTEPGLRVEVVEFGAFQYGVEDCGALAAGVGSEEHEIFTGNGNAAQCPLSDIIVDREPAITGIAAQCLLAVECVLDCPGERVLC